MLLVTDQAGPNQGQLRGDQSPIKSYSTQEYRPENSRDIKRIELKSAPLQYIPFSINIIVDGKTYFVEMSNGNLSNIEVEAPMNNTDATITLGADGFTKILLSQARLKDLIESKEAYLEGDDTVLDKLVSTLVKFDEEFEIVPFSRETVDAKLYQ